MSAKKYLGQHFLTRRDVARRIADAAPAADRLVEIGPGKGILTSFLLDRDVRLKAVELDGELIPVLRERFPGLEIIHADFLSLTPEVLFGGETFGIIGNFPYNISSQILFWAVRHVKQVTGLTGMFQREVARRVVSGPGSRDYGILSVLVQAYFEGSYLFSVGPDSFRPPPKVHSGVIRLVRKTDWALGCDESLFHQVVKRVFGQRRKMLRNTLRGLLPVGVLAEDFFMRRPEQLTVEEFVMLTNRISQFKNEDK